MDRMAYTHKNYWNVKQMLLDTNSEGEHVSSRLTPHAYFGFAQHKSRIGSLRLRSGQAAQYKSRLTTVNSNLGVHGMRPWFNITAPLLSTFFLSKGGVADKVCFSTPFFRFDDG